MLYEVITPVVFFAVLQGEGVVKRPLVWAFADLHGEDKAGDKGDRLDDSFIPLQIIELQKAVQTGGGVGGDDPVIESAACSIIEFMKSYNFV